MYRLVEQTLPRRFFSSSPSFITFPLWRSGIGETFSSHLLYLSSLRWSLLFHPFQIFLATTPAGLWSWIFILLLLFSLYASSFFDFTYGWGANTDPQLNLTEQFHSPPFFCRTNFIFYLIIFLPLIFFFAPVKTLPASSAPGVCSMACFMFYLFFGFSTSDIREPFLHRHSWFLYFLTNIGRVHCFMLIVFIALVEGSLLFFLFAPRNLLIRVSDY